MASGVPPVVLDTEVAREVYGPAAVYVAGPDPSAIATGLHTAFTNGDALRAAAPQVLMRYSWDECARRTLRAILSAA
jgi:glycosyltransferase involved in cell wall biosynthesis